jgi:hypothetical protein
MKLILILILLSLMFAGCLTTEVKTGEASQYEFPGLNNTTIFYLNISSIKVIDNVINKTSFDLLIEGNIESFKYPVAVDYSGNNVSANVTIFTVLGKNYAQFNFSSNFSGFVAYTIPGTQDFNYLPAGNGTIRVVLPENFTAGTMFLGYIQPKPDNITQDQSGREVLIWDNPAGEKIRVKYSHRDTPELLLYLFVTLVICAIIIWAYYYFSISALSKKRKMLEKGIRK